jgi:Kef-type K+ transport system membrane component KefB
VKLQFNIMLTVALAVLLGTFGARLFKRLKIPQVVAYIVIGVLLGESGLRIINAATADGLTPLSLLALGIIGFMIGGELKLEVFRRQGKQAMVILLAEGMGAFIIVTTLVGLITHNWALALLLGAISSATAPAATVDVLWEYRTLGALTTMVLAIVALDDGLALLLYGFAAAVARTMLDHSRFSLLTLGQPLYEIVGALVLGGGVALVFRWATRRMREREMTLALVLGCILLLVGVSQATGVDMILSAMAFGSLYANIAGRDGEEIFSSVQRFAPPIFVLFFVLVGARLKVSAMTGVMWLAALGYVVGRTSGKFTGAWLGSKLTQAPEAIRRFLGFCLFSQAGVAIGLAVLSSQAFAGHPEIGATIITVVTATTFLVQVIGPPSVKYAVTKAGEVGRNVTVEDLLGTFKVRDVMSPSHATIRAHAPLPEVMDTIARSEAVYFPVVQDDGTLLGVVTLERLKAVLNLPDVGNFIVAQDLVEPTHFTVQPDTTLREANQLMKDRGRDFLVVLDADQHVAGFMVARQVERLLEAEIARRRQTALQAA